MTRARSLSQLANSNVFTVDANNNRVGIGSTIPDVKLDVGGNLYADDLTIRNITGVAATFSGVVSYEDITNIDSVGIITARSYVSIADSIVHTGDTDTSIRFPSADTFTVETGGSERLRVTSDGKVGINKLSPSAALSAYHATNNTIGIFESGDSAARATFIDPSGQAHVGNEGDDLILAVTSAASEALRITSTGNVGINTNNPESMLAVVGTSGDSARIEIKRTSNNVSGYVGAVNFTALDGHSVASVSARADGDNEGAHLIFRTTSAAGENSPFGSNTFERLRITSTGNVGIGTDNPDQTLELHTGAGTNLVKVSTKANSTIGIELEKTGATTQSWRIADGQTVNGKLEFYDVTDTTTRMCLDGDGRLLVGDSNTSSQSTYYTGRIQVQGTNSDSSAILIKTNQNDSGSCALVLAKSRGTGAGSNTIVQNGDEIGIILFNAADGTDTASRTAHIASAVDGIVGVNSTPGRLQFSTTPSNSPTPIERLRIDSNGTIKFKGPLTEKCFRDTGAGLTGNYVHYLKTYGNVHWSTSNSSGTWTYDITGDGTTDLNDMMSDQETLSFTLISAQNNASYYMTELRIDGVNTHTVFWQGGSAPSAGSASGYDVYTFTIFKIANASFRIFANFTNHG